MRESRIISILIVIIMLSSLPVYTFSFANDINGNSSTTEYAVTFIESGLGSWPWYLNISRVAFSGPIYQSSYSVYLPNGSYAYSASASGYSTSYGSFTVNGTKLSISIVFKKIEYSIFFVEYGLPREMSWSVTFNGIMEQSSSNDIIFSEPNGTYFFNVSETNGYGPSPSSGYINVSGVNITENIYFMKLYAVTFIESGLGSWPWYLNISRVAFSGPIYQSSYSVYLPNGSYAYSASASGYSTSYGSFTVNGTNKTLKIEFSMFLYSIYFIESGLPNGTIWFVNISGVCSCSSENNTIKINIQNGSYNYTIENTILKGEWERYSTFKNKGIIDVQGSNVLVNVSYTIQYYIHMFEKPSNGGIIYPESGWYNGSSKINVSAIPNPNFAFVSWSGTGNGSYSGILNPVTITLKSAINETANFIELYNITFYEYGLPAETKWYVNLSNGQTFSTTETNLTFKEENGTYSYSIFTLDKDFTPYPSDGTFLVNGKNINVTIKFNLVTYRVTFIQEGLPSETLWYVNLSNGQTFSGTGATITFYELNGTYSYAIATVNKSYAPSPYSGSFTVNGTGVNITITFNLITYTVTFTENGLPLGTSWSVTLSGINKTSNANTINFNEPNGSYTFNVGIVSGYNALPSSGTIIVNGNNVNQVITFTANVTKVYTVTFTESGLPSGTIWYVNLSNGHAFSSATNTITFNEPNGTYSYIISTVNKIYSPNPSSGAFTVNGASVSESITFSEVSYNVTFTESGLPTGATWNVTLNGVLLSRSSSSISFLESNGTYSYTVGIYSGYSASPPSGTVIVNGAPPPTISITFTQVKYSVTFTESGLPTGTSWSVTLNGLTETSTNGTLTFNEPNGTYSYVISGISGYRANTYSGTINVNGNSVSNSISWTIATYSITLMENGIPTGTSWSATLTGTTFNGQSVNVTSSSTTDTITFNEPNGSYSYIIHLPSGYQSNNAKGSVNVSGNSEAATFTAQRTMNYLLIGIIAVIIIILVALGVIFLMRSKNKRKVMKQKEPPKES